MSNPIVEVKHLSHRYSVDWAIRDINFSIEKTGILGPVSYTHLTLPTT